jgi:hypothetical protein
MAIQTVFQGALYGFPNLRATIMGTFVQNIRAVKYSEKQKQDNVYGAGSEVIGVGFGINEYEGEVELLFETIQALIAIAPNGKLTQITFFDIVYTYELNGLIKKAVLKNCTFMENSIDIKSGDTSIWTSLPIRVTSIEWK